MFDYRGFLFVAVCFGGIVKVCLMDLVTGVVEHGDPGYEFRNQKSPISHHDFDEEGTVPAVGPNSRTRRNPFGQ